MCRLPHLVLALTLVEPRMKGRVKADFRFHGRGGHGDRIMATTNDRNRWYGRVEKDRTVFNPDFRVKPGEVEVLHEEWAKQYAGMLMVAPHVKGTFSGRNKEWPWDRWQELVDRCKQPCIQCVAPGARTLERVEVVPTRTFEHAVSVLWWSKLLVTTEGGLHHAAGAMNVPAVVIFGAFNQPKLFGYEGHVNLDEPDERCLGQRETNESCVAAMNRISVDRVLGAIAALCS